MSKTIKYNKLVPENSFLGDYLAYMNPLETPHAYDFWAGCWLLSCAVGRNIIIDRGGAPVYLNLFCIFVAESGITRKSTAIRHCTNFCRDIIHDNLTLIESKCTPEQLEDVLATQATHYNSSGAAITISELATFLGKERYVSAMPTLLTDLYDCASVRTGGGTVTRGNRILKNIFVSFIGASTPNWLVRAVNPDVIEGGFTSRVMFIVANEPKHRSPWPEPQDELKRASILSKLERVRIRAKEIERIQISEGARRVFEKWYKSRTLHRDVFRSSFQSREDAHILRLAAFFCINDDTWHIQHNHILSAIKIITQVREDGASIFEGTGATSKYIIGLDKIRDKILSAGITGAAQREITKACSGYLDSRTMRNALDIMHELGFVQRFEVPAVAAGRPTTIWRATQALVATNAIDRIVEKHRLGEV